MCVTVSKGRLLIAPLRHTLGADDPSTTRLQPDRVVHQENRREVLRERVILGSMRPSRPSQQVKRRRTTTRTGARVGAALSAYERNVVRAVDVVSCTPICQLEWARATDRTAS